MHALAMSRESPPVSSPAAAAAPAFRHEPVLVAEVLSLVPPAAAERAACMVVDGTVGGGGHAAALLEHLPGARLFGCDRDGDAVLAARERLARYGERAVIKQLPFAELPHHLLVGSVDFLLADLGVSSHQIEAAPRGFSFTQDGPLDMRMDAASDGSTAADLLARLRPEALRDLLWRYGEERFAPRIAAAIVAARAEAPIATTAELARIVVAAVPGKFHRRGLHPATRVFQALRIAVNDELAQLEQLLDVALPLLKPGGRLAVISFHSLEDRPVKERFRAWEQPCTCPRSMPACVCGKLPQGRRITRKPVSAGPDEIARNPRSRSAKLRVFEKAAEPDARAKP